ncbi:MAG: flagellar assembly protein FliH [Proteobacteria bacterium]|nr:flagellar assembly protein FliH [Pseudomonadota bacterium]MBU1649767.1 flagellar assembly protein FliH [Pseudomonadota bacterium]MBU1986650.1 flagellar assembly protein FliH [Pseudomonadota bacterium]
MSLSKVYKNSDSFVPEQILPHQEQPIETSWQELDDRLSSQSRRHNSFVPDKTNGYDILSDKHPLTHLTPEQLSDKESILSPESLSTGDEDNNEPSATAIDLELIRQQAFAEGVVEGRRQSDEDFGTCALTLSSACDQLTHLHETILQNNLNEMHRLVMEIAEKVIRHSIREQSDTILATIEDAIRLAIKSEEFQIRVNPEDLESIKLKKKEIIEEISGLDNIVLKADSSVERGGCLLESVNCTVDATISSQLQVIQEALESELESAPVAATYPGEP